jgi:hypothetical protein
MHIMARVAYSAPLASSAMAVVGLALVPLAASVGDKWSIDQELMGPGWQGSSWMLRKGLDVVEGLAAEAIPPEWQSRWWVAAGEGA